MVFEGPWNLVSILITDDWPSTLNERTLWVGDFVFLAFFVRCSHYFVFTTCRRNMRHIKIRTRRKRWRRKERARRRHGKIRRRRPMKRADNSRISRVSLISCRTEVCKHWSALRNSFTGFGLKKKKKSVFCREREEEEADWQSGFFWHWCSVVRYSRLVT